MTRSLLKRDTLSAWTTALRHRATLTGEMAPGSRVVEAAAEP